MNFSSKLVENAVNSLASLPGIGKRTALRLVLYLLKKDKINTYRIADSIKALIDNINYCNICHNICEENICSI